MDLPIFDGGDIVGVEKLVKLFVESRKYSLLCDIVQKT